MARRPGQEWQGVSVNRLWLILVSASCLWSCAKDNAAVPTKATTTAPDAGAATVAKSTAKPTVPLNQPKRTPKLKYNVKYPDPGLEVGHSFINQLAMDILRNHEIAKGLDKEYARDINNNPLTGANLVQYGAAWADHPWLGRPENPDGVVWNPSANWAITNYTDESGRLWPVIYNTVEPAAGRYTFAPDLHPRKESSNWNQFASLTDKVIGEFWVGGPTAYGQLPLGSPSSICAEIGCTDLDVRWRMSKWNVCSHVGLTGVADPSTAGAADLAVFPLLLGGVDDLGIWHFGEAERHEYATDHLYHYAHADVPYMKGLVPWTPLLDKVYEDVVLYPVTSAHIPGIWPYTAGVADDMEGQRVIAGAGYGAATYGAILYQIARKFFVGSPGAPTLADLIPAGNTNSMRLGPALFATGEMKGAGAFESLAVALPATYLGGMPFLCYGGTDVNDPCKDGYPMWPIWVPSAYNDSDMGAFQSALLNPFPARNDVAAFIYLGWAVHMIEDLSLPHHAANWTGKEHDKQDTCGEMLHTWWKFWPAALQPVLDSIEARAVAEILGPKDQANSHALICNASMGLDDASVPASGLNWQAPYTRFVVAGGNALRGLQEEVDILGPCSDPNTLCLGPRPFPTFCANIISEAVLSAVRLLYCALPEVWTPPDPPSGLLGTSANHGAILAWDATSQSGVTYRVQQYQASDDSWTDVVCVDPNPAANRCAIGGLENDVGYSFSVYAQNEVGMSDPVFATVKPHAVVLPAPTGLVAIPSDAAITLSWDADFMGLVSYAVYIAKETPDGRKFADYTRMVWHWGESTVLGQLENGRKYKIRIAGIWMGEDEGMLSDPVFATPVPAIPDAPNVVSAIGRDGSVELFWAEAKRALSYYVFVADPYGWTRMAGSYFDDLSTDVKLDSALIPDLVNGWTYGFVIVALNEAGPSAVSNYVEAMPRPAPGAVLLTGDTGSNGEIILSWTADPFADIYSVTMSHAGQETQLPVPTGATTLVIPDLLYGEQYYFRVYAANTIDWGPPSNEVGPLMPGFPSTPPAQPAQCTAVAGNRQATISWSLVDGAVAYSVQIGATADGTLYEYGRPPAPPLVREGLHNGTTYYFGVASVGANGMLSQPCIVAVVPNVACQCTGSDIGAGQVSVGCGESLCGADNQTYACTSSGWSAPQGSCGSCQCSGGIVFGGEPVTTLCGETVCGLDKKDYTCTSTGWVGPGQECQPCASCTGGVDIGRRPVQPYCGQSVCGTDNNRWTCHSWGWTGPGTACPVCQCSGYGADGQAVTAHSGERVCDESGQTHTCTCDGWTEPEGSCDACKCEYGIILGGTGVTGYCGQRVCGLNRRMFECKQGGWVQEEECDLCQCMGVGKYQEPASATCGQTACRADGKVHSCSAAGWADTGQLCTACQCSGAAESGGAFTTSCGQSACNTGHTRMYECTPSGWSDTGKACPFCANHTNFPSIQRAWLGETGCSYDNTLSMCTKLGWASLGTGCTP